MSDAVILAIVGALGTIVTTAVTGIFTLLLKQQGRDRVVAAHVAEVAVKATEQAHKVEQIHGLVNTTHQEALREIVALRGLISRQTETIEDQRALIANRRSTDRNRRRSDWPEGEPT